MGVVLLFVGSFGLLFEESSALLCIHYLGGRVLIWTTSTTDFPCDYSGFFFSSSSVGVTADVPFRWLHQRFFTVGRLLPLRAFYICCRSDSPLPCIHWLALRFPSGSAFFVRGRNARTCLFFWVHCCWALAVFLTFTWMRGRRRSVGNGRLEAICCVRVDIFWVEILLFSLVCHWPRLGHLHAGSGGVCDLCGSWAPCGTQTSTSTSTV